MENIVTWFSLLQQGPGHAATESVTTGLDLAIDF